MVTIYLVIEQIDLGYHVHCAFTDQEEANAYRQYLADNDSLVQKRKDAGDQYADPYGVQDMVLLG